MSSTMIAEKTQYLTFTLAGEVFAFDISKVREVLDVAAITKIPGVPDFMCGVINLRGRVVPVVDLRVKFGMTKTERSVNTCIIIIEVALEGEQVILGALSDSVQEVFDMGAEDIEPPPRIGTGLRTNIIMGMGKRDDGFVIILDIDRIFSGDELSIVQAAGDSLVHEEPAPAGA